MVYEGNVFVIKSSVHVSLSAAIGKPDMNLSFAAWTQFCGRDYRIYIM